MTVEDFLLCPRRGERFFYAAEYDRNITGLVLTHISGNSSGNARRKRPQNFAMLRVIPWDKSDDFHNG